MVDFRSFSFTAPDAFGFSFDVGSTGLVRVEPAAGTYAPQTSGDITAAWFQMASPYDEWVGFDNTTYSCFVSLYGRDPTMPTTIAASVGDDFDPKRDTNREWTMWVGPGGEAQTFKSVVNPDTRVQQFSDSHATTGVIRDWTDFVLFIPTEELAGVDLLKPVAACAPADFSDYGRHTRDVVEPIPVEDAYFQAYMLLGPRIVEIDPPVEEQASSTTQHVASSTTQPAATAATRPVAVGRADSEPAGSSNALPAAMVALGLLAMAGGAWAYRRASGAA